MSNDHECNGIPAARQTLGSGSERKGAGFAVTAGYLPQVWGALHFGFRLSYESLSFDEQGGLELEPRPNVTRFTPQLGIALEF